MNVVTRTYALLALTSALMACSTLEPYRAPDTITDYATIEATAFAWGKRTYAYLMSLDRRRIDRKSDDAPDGADGVPMRKGAACEKRLLITTCVVVEPGLHKVHIMICETGLTRKCADAILSLDAKMGHRYLVAGKVSLRKDFADIWIEDMGSGDTVAGPLRVSGLD